MIVENEPAIRTNEAHALEGLGSLHGHDNVGPTFRNPWTCIVISKSDLDLDEAASLCHALGGNVRHRNLSGERRPSDQVTHRDDSLTTHADENNVTGLHEVAPFASDKAGVHCRAPVGQNPTHNPHPLHKL